MQVLLASSSRRAVKNTGKVILLVLSTVRTPLVWDVASRQTAIGVERRIVCTSIKEMFSSIPVPMGENCTYFPYTDKSACCSAAEACNLQLGGRGNTL